MTTPLINAAFRRRSSGPHYLLTQHQAFTTRVEVIPRPRGFSGVLKAGGGDGNPVFLAEEGPIYPRALREALLLNVTHLEDNDTLKSL